MQSELEERSTAEMIGEYAGLLWHWAWLLILLTLLAGGAAYWMSAKQTPIYQASTLVMISGAPGFQSDTYSSMMLSEQLAQTYAQVMTTRPVLDSVAERLGLEYFPATVQVQPIQNTQLMRITVQDTDPERAALIANTLVPVFAEQIQIDQASRYSASKQNLEAQLAILGRQIQTTSDALEALGDGSNDQTERIQLETTLAQYRQSYSYLLQSYESIRLAEAQSMSNIIQKEPAVPQMWPIQPQPMQSAVLAAMVGFAIAIGIIFLTEFLNDTLRDPQEITRKWGVPILGVISNFKTNGDMLITVRQPRAPVSEAFRSLRTNLQFASVDSPLQNLLVTSPSPGDGKSTIVSNLASVIAQSGQSTVVMDADLRRPTQHRSFHVSNRVGMSDLFLQSQDRLDSIPQSTEVQDLQVISSGGLPPNPSELLGSDKMFDIIDKLSKKFNVTIIDTPPALVVTDAMVLAPHVSGVLLVVKPGMTKRAAVKHTIEQMKRVGANLLGVVLNDVKLNRSRYSYYRGYYHYQYYRGYHYYSHDGSGLPRRKAASGSGQEIQKPLRKASAKTEIGKQD